MNFFQGECSPDDWESLDMWKIWFSYGAVKVLFCVLIISDMIYGYKLLLWQSGLIVICDSTNGVDIYHTG